MKTNFEKWRDSLTPEKVNEFREACETRTAEDILDRTWPCHSCPAFDACCTTIKHANCRDLWLEWANAPAKEEE